MSSTGVGRRRSRAEVDPAESGRFADDDRGGADARSGPAGPGGRRGRPDGPRPPAGGPRPPADGPRSADGTKARYNSVRDDWREHTGSWAAEPDTSSWTRDPDTGQWSRSDDDPRVQAWRQEASRRESTNHGNPPRLALPAGPSASDDGGRGNRRDQDQDDDWRTPPGRDGGPSSAPRSAMPSSSPRSAMPSSAPRSAMPSSAPRSAMPYGSPPPGGEPGYQDRDERGYRGREDRGYPGGAERGYPGGEPGYPDRGEPGYPGRDEPDYPERGRGRGSDAPANAPRSGTAYGSPRRALPSAADYGNAPTSGPSYGGSGSAYGGEAGSTYGGGAGSTYGSSAAAGGPTYGGAAPTSGTAYGSPRRELPSGRSRPDDATAFGGPRPAARPTAVRPRPRAVRPTAPPAVNCPAVAPMWTRRAPLRAARLPSTHPVTHRAAASPTARPAMPAQRRPLRHPPQTRGSRAPDDWRRDLDPEAAGRRRVEEPAGADDWRRDLDPDGAGRRRAEEPPGANDWRRDLDPESSRQSRGFDAAAEAPSWTLGEPANKDLSSWRLTDDPESGRGSAGYREGGADDWRRDLADQSNLADGESRRYGTSDYVPFRSSGSAAVAQSSNLSSTSTSLISPVPREQRDGRPQWSGGFQSSSTGSYERRPVTGSFPTIRKSDLLDPDDEEDDQDSGGPLAAVGYTVIWYGVPIVLFIIYMLVVDTGSKSHALDTLSGAAPQFLTSLVLSVLVAVGLRKFSTSWKAISVGLAAAVVGGGLATVLASAITGNSLS
ncbi:hypothetical protein [Paractinoplanes durhamensis]|uniref:hypothetical protein n=1 Tax=Paractinoplanes durhamensis TaxID=113563 RepID=UPI00363DD7E0